MNRNIIFIVVGIVVAVTMALIFFLQRTGSR